MVIEDYLRENNISKREFGERLHVSPSMITNWSKGSSTVSKSCLIRLWKGDKKEQALVLSLLDEMARLS